MTRSTSPSGCSRIVMIALLTVFAAALRGSHSRRAVGAGGFRAVPFLTQLFAAAAYQLSWSI